MEFGKSLFKRQKKSIINVKPQHNGAAAQILCRLLVKGFTSFNAKGRAFLVMKIFKTYAYRTQKKW